MKKISFVVFVIWILIFVLMWNIFDSLGIKNPVFFVLFDFPVDLKFLITFVLQFLAVWLYFFIFQKENLKSSGLRSLIFNFLIYLVYVMLILRVKTV